MRFATIGVCMGLAAFTAGAVRADPPAPAAPSGRPPAITNPDWAETPNGDVMAAAYPRAAQAAGVEGSARIQCKVAVDGLLYDCVVLWEAPLGWDFGLATMYLSTSFRMKPKTQDGAPVAGGTVVIPVAWRMRQAATPLHTPTEEDLALARRLQLAMHMNQAQAVLANFYGAEVAPVIRKLDPDHAQALTSTWKNAAVELEAEFDERHAQALAQVYSHQELADMTAFFESSSGRAYLTHMVDVWSVVGHSDTRASYLAFIDGWQAAYCGQTSCGEVEMAMFGAMRRRAQGLPSGK